MSVQDDARENRMVDLFNLDQAEDRVRHATDATLKIGDRSLDFELKSVTTRNRGLTTVRDFGPDHIAKWKDKHWLVSVFDGNKLLYCKYGSPAAMASWIEGKWQYIKADSELAQHLPGIVTLDTMRSIIGTKDVYTLADAKKLHKAQYTKEHYVELMDITKTVKKRLKPIGYSPDRMLQILKDRVKYVIERGSTLNNPHVPASYYGAWPEIRENHALRLRELVKEWITANEPQANVPLQEPHDTP